MRFHLVFLIVFHLSIILLVEVDNSVALKCYTCKRSKTTDKCPNEIGELKTCIYPDEVCFRMYKTALADYDAGEEGKHLQVGETHKTGCTFLKSYSATSLGCRKYQTHLDFCACNTDRCNNEDLVMEKKD